jgi:hypothetical protein
MSQWKLLAFALVFWPHVASAQPASASDTPDPPPKKEPVPPPGKTDPAGVLSAPAPPVARPAVRSSRVRIIRGPGARQSFGQACAELAAARRAEQKAAPAKAESEEQLKRVQSCGQGKEHAGTAAASAGVSAIQGLGDFLVARAEDELVLYGVEQVGLNLCSDATVARLFKESCTELRPADCTEKPETDCSVDAEAITSGRFQAAFRRDIRQLPVSIVDISGVDPTHKLYLRSLSRAAADVMLGSSPQHFAALALSYLKEEASAVGGFVPCNLDALTPTCGAALVLTAAVSALEVVVSSPDASRDGGISFETWLNRTAVAYCRDFANAPQEGNIECISGSRIYANVLDVSEAWLQSYTTVLQALHSFEQLAQGGKPTPEEVMAFAEHLATGIETTALASFKLAGCLKAGAACDPDSVELPKEWKTAASATRFSGALAAAVMGRDVPGALRAARGLIALAQFENKARVLRAVDFGVALSLSKNREESKAVIEALADPIASYRAKYGMQSGTRITLNGFVGAIASFQRTLKTNSKKRRGAFRFGAPVGIDITQSALSGSSFHGGLGIIGLDPLALASVDTEGESPDADWRTALTPGAYLRLGLFHSPITLLALGTYQPFNERREDCASDCWRGAWQVGGALAVDIPIITLK